MAKVFNLTKRQINLPSLHAIPPLDRHGKSKDKSNFVEMDNATIRGDNFATLEALRLSGQVEFVLDPEPEFVERVPVATAKLLVDEAVVAEVPETPKDK